ncbi:MAG: hypothetical protein EXX96DRAFT_491871 [Benjaminiella poitrasii]|nr:MAG: hypothetical protein EXX96DRAFT_491871 [Benjaminiella poitrasii]
MQLSSSSPPVKDKSNRSSEEETPYNGILTEAAIRSVFPSQISVHSSDNFVTVTPAQPTKAPKAPKKANKANKAMKTVFKESVFVSESPNSFKKKAAAATFSINQNASADDNSDEDMMEDTKQMSSKERRQLRNKISARNFRVRRKEYINHLEQKVRDCEETIQKLQKENKKLQKDNEELIKTLSVQPITPPSSGDELLSSLSASGSEGHLSPETIASAFQLQFNDLYNLNLFDQNQTQQQQQQQQPSQPQQTLPDPSLMFYLNHAAMPDWNMSEILSEKFKSATTEEEQRQISRELLQDYPLLAPALMSIILHHTLSLDYVASIAKEFTEKFNSELVTSKQSQETTNAFEDDIDNLKASMSKLAIKGPSTEKESDTDEKPITEEGFVAFVLNQCFPYYCMMRARGQAHEDIIEACRRCYFDPESPCGQKMKKKFSREKVRKEKLERKHQEQLTGGKSKRTGLSLLQTYCRVAGVIMKNPHRMTRMSQVLKEQIQFPKNKQATRIEQNYKNTINVPSRNLCITSDSR